MLSALLASFSTFRINVFPRPLQFAFSGVMVISASCVAAETANADIALAARKHAATIKNINTRFMSKPKDEVFPFIIFTE